MDAGAGVCIDADAGRAIECGTLTGVVILLRASGVVASFVGVTLAASGTAMRGVCNASDNPPNVVGGDSGGDPALAISRAAAGDAQQDADGVSQ